MFVAVDCATCDAIIVVKVVSGDFTAWKNGMAIQTAMPYLTPDEREMFISHTCGECWDSMFGFMEDANV